MENQEQFKSQIATVPKVMGEVSSSREVAEVQASIMLANMTPLKYQKYRPEWCKHPAFRDGHDYCWGLAIAADEGQKEVNRFYKYRCPTCEFYNDDLSDA